MKKDCVYFVQDAYGYLCNVDALSFDLTIGLWKEYDCHFTIVTEDKGAYKSKKLFRI